MKGNKSIALVAVMAIFLSSCGDHNCEEGKPCDHDKEGKSCNHTEKDVETEALEVVTEEESVSENESTVVLELNEGNKWDANDETHIGMGKMQDVLKTFEQSEEKSYVKLGEDLSAQTTYIIQNCDMTGPDHDMLHKVLHPILETIEKISLEEDAEKNVSELNTLLRTYFEYFQ